MHKEIRPEEREAYRLYCEERDHEREREGYYESILSPTGSVSSVESWAPTEIPKTKEEWDKVFIDASNSNNMVHNWFDEVEGHLERKMKRRMLKTEGVKRELEKKIPPPPIVLAPMTGKPHEDSLPSSGANTPKVPIRMRMMDKRSNVDRFRKFYAEPQMPDELALLEKERGPWQTQGKKGKEKKRTIQFSDIQEEERYHPVPNQIVDDVDMERKRSIERAKERIRERVRQERIQAEEREQRKRRELDAHYSRISQNEKSEVVDRMYNPSNVVQRANALRAFLMNTRDDVVGSNVHVETAVIPDVNVKEEKENVVHMKSVVVMPTQDELRALPRKKRKRLVRLLRDKIRNGAEVVYRSNEPEVEEGEGELEEGEVEEGELEEGEGEEGEVEEGEPDVEEGEGEVRFSRLSFDEQMKLIPSSYGIKTEREVLYEKILVVGAFIGMFGWLWSFL